MTDLPEPVGPQADDALPRRAAPLSAAGLPQRRPVTDPDTDTTGWSVQRGQPDGPAPDDPLPRRGAPLSAAGLPQRRPVTDPDTDTTGWSLQRGESGATQSGPLPRWIPNSGGGAQPPPRREPAASQSAPLPQR
ncbi:MAG TPA: hypothetical protein VEJ42_10395, partial [Streptosporangiaceae bacterium]|nr:hypothetical protein [Streptosporangiaceae bacterium]